MSLQYVLLGACRTSRRSVFAVKTRADKEEGWTKEVG